MEPKKPWHLHESSKWLGTIVISPRSVACGRDSQPLTTFPAPLIQRSLGFGFLELVPVLVFGQRERSETEIHFGGSLILTHMPICHLVVANIMFQGPIQRKFPLGV